MKKLLTGLLALLAAGASASAPHDPAWHYEDARSLTVIGRPVEFPARPFARLDGAAYGLRGSLAAKCAQSTGLAIAFTTDSRSIRVKWETSDLRTLGVNTGAVCQKGVDLYIRKGGKWIFAGVGAPDMKGDCRHHEATVVTGMDSTRKECLLYLPLFDRVEQLEIGVEEGAALRPLDNPFRHRIVFHGSSITHGSAASRSGMSYVARFGRDNGLYCINLGFSGQCRLQPEFARCMADIEADAFVFDAFSNPRPEEIAERFDAFVDTVRAVHPDTPLIFLQTLRREKRIFNRRIDAFEAEKQRIAEERVRSRMKRDKHLYFICWDDSSDDESGFSADGVHPTDAGFSRMLDKITPPLKRILRKYGIR